MTAIFIGNQKTPKIHNATVTIDCNGAALSPATIERIEEILAPFAEQGAGHVDVLLRRIAIYHQPTFHKMK